MTKKDILVYIYPTYNERENIIKTLKETNKASNHIKNYKTLILVVDDNSPDGTANLVKKFQKTNPHVRLLSGKRNGLGSAMIRGIKFAINSLKADLVVLNEADMSYLPSDSVDMVKLVQKKWDVVAATRILKKDNQWPIDRKIIHKISNVVFAEMIAGVKEVSDHNCAFRAIRVKGILDQIDFNDFPTGFSFFNYLIYKLSNQTEMITNFPVIYYPRTLGESKISFKPKHLKNLIKNFYEYFKICFKIRFEKMTYKDA